MVSILKSHYVRFFHMAPNLINGKLLAMLEVNTSSQSMIQLPFVLVTVPKVLIAQRSIICGDYIEVYSRVGNCRRLLLIVV